MEGKVAIITDATSGIGVHTAILLASLGYTLTLLGRNSSALKETAEKCVETGQTKDRILTMPLNIELEEMIEHSVAKTIEKFDRLDLLFNSATIFVSEQFEKMSMSKYDSMFRINVRSMYYFIKMSIPYLNKTQGSVVNLSSACASMTLPTLSVFCATQKVVNYLTRSIALELEEFRIRVNALFFGPELVFDYRKNKQSLKVFDPSLNYLVSDSALNEFAKAVAVLADNKKTENMTANIIQVSREKNPFINCD